MLKPANNFHGVKEVVESQGPILLVLGLAKFFALLHNFCNNMWWRLCALELSPLLRLLLCDDNLSEAVDLRVVIQIVVFAASDQF